MVEGTMVEGTMVEGTMVEGAMVEGARQSETFEPTSTAPKAECILPG